MTDPKTEEEEKNDKGKNDFRWVDENVKMSRLYVLPIQKDATANASRANSHRKLSRGQILTGPATVRASLSVTSNRRWQTIGPLPIYPSSK